eukprot:TRINITY_DN48586_c0_g1_i1.p1 TRINITY_DN48586_c0_g1~~TRINITY_DN48586_c0_g1_i1.p1  ORF type:complete len:906 (+),score=180.77 TRINITY_DN48586_c0_g1_i1:253-2718(+)
MSSVHGIPMQAFNRGKESVYNEALDAYKEGIDNIGDQITSSVSEMFQKAVEDLRIEFDTTTSSNQAKLDEKMNKLLGKVQHLMSHSSAGLMDGQGEANQKTLAENLTRIQDQLSQVHGQLMLVPAKEELAELTNMMTSSLDLQGVLRTQEESFNERLIAFRKEIKVDVDRVNDTVNMIRDRMDLPAVVDFTNVVRDVDMFQNMVSQDFQLLFKELTKVQKALNMDYMQLEEMSEAHHKEEDAVIEEDGIFAEYFEHRLSLSMPVTPTASLGTASMGSEPGASFMARRNSNSHSHRTTPMMRRKEGQLVSEMKRKKRVREFWTQTGKTSEEGWCQTDPDLLKKRPHKAETPVKKDMKAMKPGISDAAAMKEKARRALVMKAADVTDLYHSSGKCQVLARSNIFDNLTLVVVMLNALWIAVDVDHNKASILIDADPVFQVMENLFCTYFFVEVMIRFCAFAKKRNACRDRWFIFDSILVFNMVIETWLVPVIMVASGLTNMENTLDVSMLRVFRLVKLLRLLRISKILRAMPELIVIVKAIGFAARTVGLFICLWTLIIYLFAITFRQLTDRTVFGDSYFPSVTEGMSSLLLDGILPDFAPIMRAAGAQHPGLWLLMMIFVMLCSITVMYMLVGILVEVVSVISAQEKENMTVTYVASKLRDKMGQMGHNTETALSKGQFQALLIEPDVCDILSSVNVDVVVLMDILDIIYEDLDKQGGLMTFEKVIGVILDGRGGNFATVRDTKEGVRVMKSAMTTMMSKMHRKVSKEFDAVHARLRELRDDALARDGLDPDEADEPYVAKDSDDEIEMIYEPTHQLEIDST